MRYLFIFALLMGCTVPQKTRTEDPPVVVEHRVTIEVEQPKHKAAEPVRAPAKAPETTKTICQAGKEGDGGGQQIKDLLECLKK